MKEIFCYQLGPFPWAPTDSVVTLKKTNKAILMRELEENIEPRNQVLSNKYTIIDDLVLIRKIKTVTLT